MLVLVLMLHLYGADESTLFVIDCRLCFDYVLDEAQCRPNKQNFGTSQLSKIMSGLHAQIQLQECHRQLEQNEYKMLTYFY